MFLFFHGKPISKSCYFVLFEIWFIVLTMYAISVVRSSLPEGSENIQQIYRRPPMPKCDFNIKLQSNFIYWNHTLAYVFSCKFAAYSQNTFSHSSMLFLRIRLTYNCTTCKYIVRYLQFLWIRWRKTEHLKK